MQPQRSQYRADQGSNDPRDELDVAHSIVGSTDYDELLQLVNMGTGFYEDEDLRLQMRSFRKGLVAEVAFDGALWDRAVYETKVKLADEGFRYYNEQTEEVKVWKPLDELAEEGDEDGVLAKHGRTTALRRRGEEIWSDLADPAKTLSEQQAAALAEKASIQAFKPVFWRMLAAYHEASKSRGGRTQDNFFGRVKKHFVESDDDDAARSLLSRNKNT